MEREEKKSGLVFLWAVAVVLFSAIFGYNLYSNAPSWDAAKEQTIERTRTLPVSSDSPVPKQLLCFEVVVGGKALPFVTIGTEDEISALRAALQHTSITPTLGKDGNFLFVTFEVETSAGRRKVKANQAMTWEEISAKP